MHDELPGLSPDILSNCGEGHIEWKDGAVAQDLVQLVATRARVVIARARGGCRSAVNRGTRRHAHGDRRVTTTACDLVELVLDLYRG